MAMLSHEPLGPGSDTETESDEEVPQLQAPAQPVLAPAPPALAAPAPPSVTGGVLAPLPKPPPPSRSTKSGTSSKGAARRPAGAITIKTLVDAGLLVPGVRAVYVDYKGSSTFADLTSEGQIHLKGMLFDSPSAFSIYIKRLVNPTRKADDGWKAVKYNGRVLETYKDDYLRLTLPPTQRMSDSTARAGSVSDAGSFPPQPPAPPPPPKKMRLGDGSAVGLLPPLDASGLQGPPQPPPPSNGTADSNGRGRGRGRGRGGAAVRGRGRGRGGKRKNDSSEDDDSPPLSSTDSDDTAGERTVSE